MVKQKRRGDRHAGVEIEDNTGQVIDATKQAILRALEIIGGQAETYAKGLVAPMGPKGNPMPSDIKTVMLNSITHEVNEEKQSVSIGSNYDLAAYVELGTGILYEPPPEWIENNVKVGKHGGGLSSWIFYDEESKTFKLGLPISPQPFLQPAIQDHMDDYKEIIKGELGTVGG